VPRRNPDAVTNPNHLNLCMAATANTWIDGGHLEPPLRRYPTTKRTKYAFANLQRRLA
jgi:hypothetical protein